MGYGDVSLRLSPRASPDTTVPAHQAAEYAQTTAFRDEMRTERKKAGVKTRGSYIHRLDITESCRWKKTTDKTWGLTETERGRLQLFSWWSSVKLTSCCSGGTITYLHFMQLNLTSWDLWKGWGGCCSVFCLLSTVRMETPQPMMCRVCLSYQPTAS